MDITGDFDLLNAADEEILAEFAELHGSPGTNAAEMLALFEETVIRANKQRVVAARAGATAEAVRIPTIAVVATAEARATHHRLFAAHADNPAFTLAARKENELFDEDVLDLLNAMRELGLIKP